MLKYPIIDLHCDLLAFLEQDEAKNSPFQSESNCSIPQMKEGGVVLQTLAIFSETKEGSVASSRRQIDLYNLMLRNFKDDVASLAEFGSTQKIHFILAIENASGLLEETEDFDHLFERLELFQEIGGPILYVSLTWNEENRFGGGNHTKVGLKRDGEIFLEYLSGKNIAIDFSHTSDALANDILNFIHKKGLALIPIASHSNFRSVKNHPRNLPDAVAKEIIALGGVIGMNFVRHFIGEKANDFTKHIQHGLDLGGQDALCLGADFFGGILMPSLEHLKPFYQEEFSNSSCYPRFLHLLQSEFLLHQIEKIAHLNMNKILEKRLNQI